MMKLAIVGYGTRVHFFLETLKSVEPNLKIVGILDTNRDGVLAKLDESVKNDVVFYDSVQEMMLKAKPDSVTIGTNCDTHAKYAIELSRHDVPMFLEKPVAVSMQQAIELEESFANRYEKTIVSFPLRHSPVLMHVQKIIADGEIGTPEHITAVNYVPYGSIYWEQWYRNCDITKGLLLQKATHDLDYISLLMGSPIVSVATMSMKDRVFGGSKPAELNCDICEESYSCPESPKYRKIHDIVEYPESLMSHPCLFSSSDAGCFKESNEDCSSTLLEFENGRHGVYTQVFFSRRSAAKRGAILSGYKGTLRFDWYKGQIDVISHHQNLDKKLEYKTDKPHFGGDLELAKVFISLTKTGKKQGHNSIMDGIQSVYACLAAKKSAQNRTFEKVRQVGRV